MQPLPLKIIAGFTVCSPSVLMQSWRVAWLLPKSDPVWEIQTCFFPNILCLILLHDKRQRCLVYLFLGSHRHLIHDASPFFETELPSLVLCETTEWFPHHHRLRSFLFAFSTKCCVRGVEIVETSFHLLRIYWSRLFSLVQFCSSYLS